MRPDRPMSRVSERPDLQNCSLKNLSNMRVAWESCHGSDEYRVTVTLLTSFHAWTLATLSWRTAAEPRSKFQYTLRKQGVASGVLETKAYLHRRPAYNPETFPHCPRWKRCCWLESFGAVHMSMTHHVTVAISVFVISLLTALHVHFLLTFFEVLKLVGAHRRNPT
jgi:hypothetical protein